METHIKLWKSKNIIQVVANCIEVDTPAESSAFLFNIRQHPIAYTDVLLQQCADC